MTIHKKIDLFFQNTFPNVVQRKIFKADLDLSHRILYIILKSQVLLRCLGLYLWELILSALDNIVLARTSDNLVRARFSSIKVNILLDLRSYYAI